MQNIIYHNNISEKLFCLFISIIISTISLQSQICNGSLGDNIFSDGDFGQGVENIVIDNPEIAPGYLYSSTPPPEDGFYTITNSTEVWDDLFVGWFNLTDNSDNPNGYMMIVNASFEPGIFYQNKITNLCENTMYLFSVDLINVNNANVNNAIYPNINILIDGLTFYETGDIPRDEQWHNYNFVYVTQTGQTDLLLSLVNNAPGGRGNDLGIDNISFQPCGPETNILPDEVLNICSSDQFTLEAENFNSPNNLDYIQWQSSLDGVSWTNIGIPSSEISIDLIANFQDGFFRYVVGSSIENLTNSQCFVTSEIVNILVLERDDCGVCLEPTDPNFNNCTDYTGTPNGAAGTFQKIFGGNKSEIGVGVEIVDDNLFVVSNTFSYGAGKRDVMLNKLDNQGEIIWTKIMGTPKRNLSAGIKKSGDNLLLFGQTVQNNTSNLTDDVFLWKYDLNGNMIWEQFYGGKTNDEDEHMGNFTPLENGEIAFTAYNLQQPYADDSGIVVKTNNLGEIIWGSQFKNKIPNQDPEQIHNIIAYKDNLFASGNIVYSNSKESPFFFMKLDQNGQLAWWKYYNIENKINGFYSAGDTDNVLHSLENGDFLLIGQIEYSESNRDILLIKVDENGNTLWAKSMGGNGKEMIYSSFQDDNGMIYLGGRTNSMGADKLDGLIIKMDAEATILWTKTYGGVKDDVFREIKQANNGDIIAIGNTESFGAKESDIYLVRTDSEGHIFGGGCVSDHEQFEISEEIITQKEGGTFKPWNETTDYDFQTESPSSILCTEICCVVKDTTEITICSGESYEGYAQAGQYEDVFTTASGCDSVRILNLTLIEASKTEVVISICEGEEYEDYTTSGIYVDTFFGQFCDSTRILNLTVLETKTSNIAVTICEGEIIEGYTTTGVYTDFFQTTSACDSTRILDLTVLEKPKLEEAITICEGESYLGHTEMGTYRNTLFNSSGCDSLYILNLTVLATKKSGEEVNICEGESYKGYTETGIHQATFSGMSGCDSVHTIDLKVQASSFSEIEIIACNEEGYQGYFESGIYEDTFLNQYGCDSTRILNLELSSSIETIIYDTICARESLFGYNKTGIYTDIFPLSSGCDSIRILNLEANSIYIPSAFSPNDDGINDFFELFSNNKTLFVHSFLIYDRWGNKIYNCQNFKIDDECGRWNGEFNSQLVNPGIYIYSLNFECRGQTISYSGEFNIII